MSVYCTLFSQTFYGLLFCYLTITDVHVTLYLQIIDFQFTSCCTSQPPKKLNQIVTVNSSTNTPRSYHQKNNSCTLCVPMFIYSLINGRFEMNQAFRLCLSMVKCSIFVFVLLNIHLRLKLSNRNNEVVSDCLVRLQQNGEHTRSNRSFCFVSIHTSNK